ncbi:unnamed protein product [Diatraea saccharalis]|uniref:Histidine decarboxylase n=1 Tax=Diatraea saccharalis TaxID=40085 RepID=A0A9N9WKC1_9NEOP|nr:unnamed protein product [Diatraea saccharalis]
MRYIESDSNQSMRGSKLEEAILCDKEKGLVPFWVCATLGTTGSVAFDNLREVGEVCARHAAWLHVDAAYAGSAFLCPEYRYLGTENANTKRYGTKINQQKTNYANTNGRLSNEVLSNGKLNNGKMNVDDDSVDDLYGDSKEDSILHGYDKMSHGCGKTIQLENPDKKEPLHWQIPLSRRFRALKLWFVLRNYGVVGLQKHIRESIRLAQKFEALVLADQRFEIPQPRNLGMVAFRMKGDNALTERLLKRLNARGFIHAVPACFKGVYVIRFAVTSQRTTNQDIIEDWNEIKFVTSEILMEVFGSENGNIVVPKKPRISLKETRELNATFGTSLLLANSPMSPKIVNGTHAAICDYEQVLTSCAQTFAQLKMEPKDSPGKIEFYI